MPRPPVRALVLAALPALGSVALQARLPVDTQKIYVTVVDAKGRPVTGLTKEDFTVRLDQASQEVLGLQPAVDPASVVILTDRLGLLPDYTPFDTGLALRDFANAIRKANPDSKVALTTFDGTIVEITKFTSAFNETDRALGRLSTSTPEAVLFDGLATAAQAMRSAPSDRRIIFTLLAAYRPDHSIMQPDRLGEILRLSAASLWVLEVRLSQGGNYNNPAREQVLDNGSALSGGRREIVASRSGVSTSTRRFAELINAQYVLTFGPGGGNRNTQLVVEVKRPGVRVLAPGWTTR
jgi:Ca-activated chloride channel family protein